MFHWEETGDSACIVDEAIRKDISPVAKDLFHPERPGTRAGSFAILVVTQFTMTYGLSEVGDPSGLELPYLLL